MSDGNTLQGAAAAAAPRTAHRGRLFRKYLLLIMSLVTMALLVAGGISLYFSYKGYESALASLQREKAIGAASRIEQYVRQIAQRLEFAALPQLEAGEVEQRRIELMKLLRQAPEVTDLAQLDADGREQITESRLGMSTVGTARDRSAEPAFVNARRGKPWFSPVYFRKETEPYITIAIRSGGERGSVTVAEVNLKFIWDVVSRIKIGDKGKAYVVDAKGLLVADPDIGLVLRKTSLAELPHVRLDAHSTDAEPAMVSHDLAGTRVLAAMAPIESLDWRVFVEQPVSEVYARLNASLQWMAALLLGGLAVSALAASALARSMVRPIATLDEGARRIGEGDLEQQIVVRTGDELEGLADQFNRMTAQLRESYAGLERKVEARTAEVTEALEQQTATADILRVISGSITDAQPVFDAVVRSCQRLLGGKTVVLVLPHGGMLEARAAASDGTDKGATSAMVPWPLDRGSGAGVSILDSRVIAVRDTVEGAAEFSRMADLSVALGYRSALFVPLLRDGKAIGCLAILRADAGDFATKEVTLAQTFADQAVIAIENVRLFNETKEALEQQTATAEVLQVIGSSVADTAPVFEKILESCQRLFDSAQVGILIVGDDAQVHFAAHRGAALRAVAAAFPRPLDETVAGRVIRERRTVHVPDIAAMGDDMPASLRTALELSGNASVVWAPMVWEERGVGALFVGRQPPRPFADNEIALLKTFADQAVIAIQNARLFHEIEDKSRQLELANKHKSEFLANMSHELRTPLNAIIGFSEVLSEQMFGDVNAKQLEYLRDIHSSGHHLLGLINDILDLSKIEAGRMELELTRFHVALLLDNSATLVRERASRQGLSLALDVDAGLGEWVADERKIKQVVINLLSNAVKFTPAGGRVTLRARAVDTGLEIAVIDTGVGIAPDQQALVFEEFRQAGGDYLRKSEGTGLGLSLAKRFVELHGGMMRVESAPGQGSTFAFTLPERTLEVVV